MPYSDIGVVVGKGTGYSLDNGYFSPRVWGAESQSVTGHDEEDMPQNVLAMNTVPYCATIELAK